MKSIYQKQILAEKMRANVNSGMVQRLQILQDKDELISRGVFNDTAQLVTSDYFKKNYDGSLNKDSQTVMTYLDGKYIESLKTGEWITTIGGLPFKSKDFKAVEEELWNSFKSKIK